MTLPSPCFVAIPIKPDVETHVAEIKVKQPTSFVTYCKYCREGFASENELFRHRKAHEKCPYDDCKFNASAKTIAEHIQRVHMKTNTLVKIQDLSTPEQIEKWREERRKRYPTSANVQLRQQAKEERFSRGEKLNDRQPRFGDFQQRNHVRNSEYRQHQKDNPKHQKGNRIRNRHQRPAKLQEGDANPSIPSDAKNPETFQTKIPPTPISKKPPITQAQDEDSSDDKTRATPKFKGTSQMKDYHKIETIVKEQAALSILGMYGSDSESDEEMQEQPEQVGSKIQELPAADVEMVAETVLKEDDVHQSDNNDEAPEEIPIEHKSAMIQHEAPAAVDRNSRKRRRDFQNVRVETKVKCRSVLDYAKLRHTPSVNPFLEKLLQEDIRHERNVLLQCVNYVVKNNFFGVGPPAKIAEDISENKDDEKIITDFTTDGVNETKQEMSVEENENL